MKKKILSLAAAGVLCMAGQSFAANANQTGQTGINVTGTTISAGYRF